MPPKVANGANPSAVIRGIRRIRVIRDYMVFGGGWKTNETRMPPKLANDANLSAVIRGIRRIRVIRDYRV